MARKALIIGLGSNGMDVCEQITQRTRWEYGSLERAPWLQCVWFETAPFTTSEDNVQSGVRITVDPGKFRDLHENDQNYLESLDLPHWVDKKITSIPHAFEHGANNIRMIGRLAFLFPENLANILKQIRTRLDRLTALTAAEAKAARGPLPDGSDPDIALNDEIWVYVVGTLCGGTCSGSFIDMGYVIHNEFQSQGYKTKRVGIFSLPSISHTNKRHKANVYAGLTELNHYSTPGVGYSVQYPHYPGQPSRVSSELPYTYCYLVQSPGSTPAEYERLKTAITQYLHTEIFMPRIGTRDAERSNTASYVIVPDRLGAPQPYFTFGVSAIEIPTYLIVQGCSYKLCREAFADWLSPRALGESDLRQVCERYLGISREQVESRLLKGRDDESPLLDSIHRVLDDACKASEGGFQVLTTAEEQIERAFSSRKSGSVGAAGPATDSKHENMALPANSIADRIQKHNEGPVLNQYRDQLTQFVYQKLVDGNAGPGYCHELLQYLERWLSDRHRQIASPEALNSRNAGIDSAWEAMDAARERITTCQNDGILWVMGGRSLAVRKYLDEYKEAASSYFKWRLKGLTEPAEGRVWGELLSYVRQLQGRITDSSHGISAVASRMVSAFSERLKELNETVPPLNGEMIFDAHSTIDEKYAEAWRRSADSRGGQQGVTAQSLEKEARLAVIKSWDELPQANSETGQYAAASFAEVPFSSLDVDKQEERLRHSEEALLRQVREHFSILFRENVLEHPRVLSNSLVRDVLVKSKVMLDLGTNLVDRYEHAQQKQYGFVFYKGAADARHASGTQRQKFLKIVEQEGGAIDVPLKHAEIDEGQSVIFLQEHAAFSLPLIGGMRDKEDTGFRYSYDDESRLQTMHARSDVRAWEPVGGVPAAEQEELKGLFLAGLALYKDRSRNSRVIGFARTPRPDAMFVFDLHPPIPPAQNTETFPGNLKEVASILRLKPQIEDRLKADLARIENRDSPEQIAEDLSQFVKSIGPIKLTEAGTEVDDHRAYDLLESYFKHNYAIRTAMQRIYTQDVRVLDRFYREVGPGKPVSGYYCSNCEALLYQKQRDESVQVSDVPANCPHCETRIHSGKR